MTNRDRDLRVFIYVMKKVYRIAHNPPGAIELQLWEGIIKENHLPATLLSEIGNNLAMPASTKNGQALHFSFPVNLDAVACPSALIPSRTKTFLMVKISIRISSNRERLSTYQISRANFSGQLTALRPLT